MRKVVPLPGSALNADGPAMRIDDLLGNGQAQPAARLFRRKERIIDMVQLFAGYAAAGIRDLNYPFPFVERASYRYFPAARHSLN